MERILRLTKLTGVRYLKSMLLFLFITGSCSIIQAQTVATDKPDYAPGETVLITGSGWAPGEAVNLLIEHNFYLDHPDEFFTVTANSSGEIFWNKYIVQEWDLGEIFTLAATGLTSGKKVSTDFTDSNPPVYSINPTSGSTSGGYTVEVNTDKNAFQPSKIYTVNIGGNTTNCTYVNQKQITFTAPTHAQENVDVKVMKELLYKVL